MTFINDIIKETFFTSGAQGINQRWQNNYASTTELDEIQSQQLKDLFVNFITELKKETDISKVTIDLHDYGSSAVSKYSPTTPLTLNIPAMRRGNMGKDTCTFAEYIRLLEVAYTTALISVELVEKGTVKSLNVTHSYKNLYTAENVKAKFVYFVEHVIPEITNRQPNAKLSVTLSSTNSINFRHEYSEYDKSSDNYVEFPLQSDDSIIFSDEEMQFIDMNFQKMLFLMEHGIIVETQPVSISLQSYSRTLEKSFDFLKSYMSSLLDDVSHVFSDACKSGKYRADFAFGDTFAFDYYPGSQKSFRVEIPIASDGLIAGSTQEVYANRLSSITPNIKCVLDFIRATGVKRISLDRAYSHLITDAEFIASLLTGIKQFVEEKVEIAQRSVISIAIVPASYIRNEPTRYDYIQLPLPDCSREKVSECVYNYLNTLTFSE